MTKFEQTSGHPSRPAAELEDGCTTGHSSVNDLALSYVRQLQIELCLGSFETFRALHRLDHRSQIWSCADAPLPCQVSLSRRSGRPLGGLSHAGKPGRDDSDDASVRVHNEQQSTLRAKVGACQIRKSHAAGAMACSSRRRRTEPSSRMARGGRCSPAQRCRPINWPAGTRGWRHRSSRSSRSNSHHLVRGAHPPRRRGAGGTVRKRRRRRSGRRPRRAPQAPFPDDRLP